MTRNKYPRIKWLGLWASLLGLSPNAEQASAGELRAGAAAVDVTPHHFPVRVAGGIREKLTEHVDSPLHAKVVVLDDGERKVLVGTVDNCLVDRALLDDVKAEVSERTGIATARMLISATHTHSAPPVVGIHGSDPVDGYRAQLYGALVMAAVQADKNLEPAEMAWGSGECREWVHCRRWEMKPGTATNVKFTGHEGANVAQMNPGNGNANKVRQTGVADTEVTVWAVRAVADGRPLAVMGNYSTHYVGAPGVSADYFGVFGERMGELLGAEEVEGRPAFVGMLSNGTSGDANCIDFSKEKRAKFDDELVAHAVADVAAGALEGAVWRRDFGLRMLEREVEFDVRMPSAEEVAEAQAFLDANLGDDGLVKSWDENYARETVLLSRMPATRKLKLQALCFGDAVGMTAIPCEVYGSTGLAIKAASPFPLTMNVGLANGYEGYLPPEAQFKLGGYTTWRARSSCLETKAEGVVTRVVVGLLGGVKSGETAKAEGAFELEADDLEISLIASEPDVVDPVAMAFDDGGKLYVVEGRGYPTDEEGIGMVALLEDKDGDGRYERTADFATGLRFANGVMPWNGGVFVTDAPDLLWLKDNDGDGVADEREVVLSGFGVKRSTQLRANDPTLGVDGMVYVAGGWGQGTVTSSAQVGSLALDAGKSDLRFDPKTWQLEAADGTCQYGMSFDGAGRRFVCMNRIHATHVVVPKRFWGANPALRFSEVVEHVPAGEALVHRKVGGEASAVRLYPTSDNVTTADAHEATFSAACAVTVFESGGLPERYRGQVFSCDPTANVVHRDVLEPAGATFVARRSDDGKEFLRSSDNWFRPTFLSEGPDGALYVCDMHRGVIEHPDYLPEAVRARTSFDAGWGTGRIWRVARKGLAGEKRGSDPVVMLGSGERWERELGQRMLVESGIEGKEADLRAVVAGSGRAEGKVLALWLLAGGGAVDAELLQVARGDADPAVRENALWVGERAELLEAEWFEDVDDDGRVAFVAALVGAPVLVEEARGRFLVETVRRHGAGDRWLRAAVLNGVRGVETRFVMRLLLEEFDGKAELMREFGRVVAATGDGELRNFCSKAVRAGSGDWRLAYFDGSGERQLLEEAVGVLEAGGEDLGIRLSAVRLLGRAVRGSDRLMALLGGSEVLEIELEAAKAISRWDGGQLLDGQVWRGLRPEVRAYVLGEAVGDTKMHEALAKAIEGGVVAAGLLNQRQREQLRKAGERFGTIFAGSDAGSGAEAFEKLKPALELAGDRSVGERVFRERCATCHRLERIGYAVGPDLFGIRNQPKEAILLHVADPNREVMPGSVNYVVTKTDGTAVAGLLAGEAGGVLTLAGPAGVEFRVERDEVGTVESTGVSMMPEGVLAGLKLEEVAGLLGFLKGE